MQPHALAATGGASGNCQMDLGWQRIGEVVKRQRAVVRDNRPGSNTQPGYKEVFVFGKWKQRQTIKPRLYSLKALRLDVVGQRALAKARLFRLRCCKVSGLPRGNFI